MAWSRRGDTATVRPKRVQKQRQSQVNKFGSVATNSNAWLEIDVLFSRSLKVDNESHFPSGDRSGAPDLIRAVCVCVWQGISKDDRMTVSGFLRYLMLCTKQKHD